VDLEENEIMTMEGFINGRALGYEPYIMFYGYEEEGKIRKKYVNLFNASEIDGTVARVTGKIEEVYSVGGDVSVTEIEIVKTVEQIGESIKIVDDHWKNFSSELMERFKATDKDGGYSDPMWSEKTQELIVFRNIGNMEAHKRGSSYEVATAVFYFAKNKTITRIRVFSK
jgi:hypothetical protein